MRGIVVAFLVSGCVAAEPVSETEQDATSFQATSFQATSFQATSFQATSFQGTSFGGASFSGATLNGVALGGAGMLGTALYVWRNTGTAWEQRWPNKICNWNSTRTRNLGCTTVDLSTSPSPLAGTTFQGTFVATDGTTRTGTLQIGTASTEHNAVYPSNATSMFALNGSYAASCPLVALGALGSDGVRCDNPQGCRVDCDLWQYDLRFPNETNTPTFCPNGDPATALSGTWSNTGVFTASSSVFTFTCPMGTIEKCVRWGYRPWDTALKSDNATSASLAPYHQSCIHAAMADYCDNGTTYTTAGTAIDIYDGDASTPGFFLRHVGGTAYAYESTFDNNGATMIDHTRYPVAPAFADPNYNCPGRFATDPDGLHANWTRSVNIPASGPLVYIASAPSCSHNEHMTGRFLNANCNVACSSKMTASYPSCFDSTVNPDTAWTQTCVNAAQSLCGSSEMALHSECVVGGGLAQYSSGCTVLVEATLPSCANSWTAGCVAQANQVCTGGINSSPYIGFCGTAKTFNGP